MVIPGRISISLKLSQKHFLIPNYHLAQFKHVRHGNSKKMLTRPCPVLSQKIMSFVDVMDDLLLLGMIEITYIKIPP
jgi:hypothetical protein